MAGTSGTRLPAPDPPSPRRTHEPAHLGQRRLGRGPGVPVSAADPGADRPADADALKAEIDATREHLGHTVDELAQRLDVPSRAKERALRVRDTAVETYRESPPAVLGAAALVAVIVGIVVWRRKR